MTGYEKDELMTQTLFCLSRSEDLGNAIDIYRLLLSCRPPTHGDTQLNQYDYALEGVGKPDVFGVRKKLHLALQLCCTSEEAPGIHSHVCVFCLLPFDAQRPTEFVDPL